MSTVQFTVTKSGSHSVLTLNLAEGPPPITMHSISNETTLKLDFRRNFELFYKFTGNNGDEFSVEAELPDGSTRSILEDEIEDGQTIDDSVYVNFRRAN